MESGKPEDRAAVQEALREWQEEAELAGIRDPKALALLGGNAACPPPGPEQIGAGSVV